MVRCTGTLTLVGCALGLTQVESEVLQGHGSVVNVVGGEVDVGGEGVLGEVGSERSSLGLIVSSICDWACPSRWS